jgi:alpha-tubulin suppressor-like RCC1 family protein
VVATSARASLTALSAVLVLVLPGAPGTAAPARVTGTPEPVRIGTGTNWAQVAAGAYTCAVRTDRSMSCWGDDVVDTVTDEEDIVTFPAGARWKSIAIGGGSACGVLADASLWCTGYVGRMYHEPAQKVGADAAWSSVGLDYDSSCGLRTDATVWCWGLPPGETQATPAYSYTPRPAPVEPGHTWAGVTGDCGWDTAGEVWCWGNDFRGERGDGAGGSEGPPKAPVAVPAVRVLDAGAGTVCAVTTGRDLWCWGGVGNGEPVDATAPNSSVPVLVSGTGDWTDVSVGGGHTCGLRTDASLWCWGAGSRGQLGDGGTADRHTPVRVGSKAGWIGVSAGLEHTCGIRSDHSLWCWGSDAAQPGAAFPVLRLVAVPGRTGTSQFPGGVPR